MLSLFAESAYGTRHDLASARSFRVSGRSVESEPGRQRIATYEQGHWKAENLSYPRLHVPMAVIVSVERDDGKASRKIGDFSSFSIVDGCARADGETIARCSADCARWELTHATAGSWPIIVLESPDSVISENGAR
jgi:hypothetical protein